MQSVILSRDDLSRLDESNWLNDNVINFYIRQVFDIVHGIGVIVLHSNIEHRYIKESLKEKDPVLHDKCHFFNTYFYPALTAAESKNRTKKTYVH